MYLASHRISQRRTLVTEHYLHYIRAHGRSECKNYVAVSTVTCTRHSRYKLRRRTKRRSHQPAPAAAAAAATDDVVVQRRLVDDL